MTDFHAYILRCADASYYTGHTDNIDTRIGQHQAVTFDGYTSMRRPVELVWSERFQTRDQAFQFERRVKNWSRAKKEALIAGDWQALKRAATPPNERQSRFENGAAAVDEVVSELRHSAHPEPRRGTSSSFGASLDFARDERGLVDAGGKSQL